MWTPEEAIESCNQIGYPVMLKASWGGGGKGIRKVHSDDEVRQVFKQIQGEVRLYSPHSPSRPWLQLTPKQCRWTYAAWHVASAAVGSV